MGLMDEEFYCEKCNWFTYRHSSVPYVKPAPRCPRCGLQTRIAVVNDHPAENSLDYNFRRIVTSSTHEEHVKNAQELMDKFHRNYPLLPSSQIEMRQCRECKVGLLTQSETGLCDCCLTMFNAIASQPGLREAHIQWEAENQRRIHHKQRLMRD